MYSSLKKLKKAKKQKKQKSKKAKICCSCVGCVELCRVVIEKRKYFKTVSPAVLVVDLKCCRCIEKTVKECIDKKTISNDNYYNSSITKTILQHFHFFQFLKTHN